MPIRYKYYLADAAIVAVAWPLTGILPFADVVKAWIWIALIAIVFLGTFLLLAIHNLRQNRKSRPEHH